jgi:hypothetical protein
MNNHTFKTARVKSFLPTQVRQDKFICVIPGNLGRNSPNIISPSQTTQLNQVNAKID